VFHFTRPSHDAKGADGRNAVQSPRLSGDCYGLRGRRSKALAGAGGEVNSAFVEEYVAYHGSVYRELASRIRGALAGDYLEAE
jgi:hypothetical protein